MGERFLLYRTANKNGFEMAQQAKLMVGEEDNARNENGICLLKGFGSIPT